MATTQRALKVFFQILILLLFSACSDPASSSSDSDAESVSSGASSVQELSIPDSPGVSPADILEQVVLLGTGGPDSEKWCPCLYVENGVLYLEGFSPNQSLVLVAYDEYEEDYGSYHAHWSVDVGSSGALALSLRGYQSNYTFVAYDPSTGRQEGPRNIRVMPREDPPASAARLAQISDQVEGVNMRSTPGYISKNDSTDIVAILASGDIVEVIEGPSEADGLEWWLVSWKGFTGWVASSTKNGRTILVFDP